MSAQAVYATQQGPLRNQLQRLIAEAPTHQIDGLVHALIVPDTNLLEGGRVAAEVFKVLKGRTYQTVIVVAPSHSGGFKRINICSLDEYSTPLGQLAVNTRVRDELCDEDDDIFVGDLGHYHTAGVDAQLPFVQTMLGEVSIVPIVMGHETPDMCRELGHAIGEIMYNRPTLLIACVDITAADADGLAKFRSALETLDVDQLMKLVNSEEVGVMGKGSLLVAMLAAVRRRSDTARIFHCSAPTDDLPGFVGAVLSAG